MALSRDELRAVGGFFRSVERAGRCVVMTDLDDTLTAVFGGDLDGQTVTALAGYLDAGGTLVFNTGAPFDWFYARLLRPLTAELAARHGGAARLAQVLLILSGGNEISVFDQGGFRLMAQGQGRDKADGIQELIRLSRASGLIRPLDPDQIMYLGDAFGAGGIDRPVAGQAGIVVNVGPPVPGLPGTFVNLGGGFTRTVRILIAAAQALRAGGPAPGPAAAPPASDTAVWTFDDQAVACGGRVRVRVGASGYVHAGVTHPGGRWAPVYQIPLIPAAAGAFEAVLPPDVDAFTFFWTQPPTTPGHPGHWEREEHGGRIFRLSTPIRRTPATATAAVVRDGGVVDAEST